MRISDSQGGANYSSKEGANEPKLLVALGGATPQSCSGTATATPTPGATNTPTPTNTTGPSPTPTNTSAPTATQPPQGAFNNATFVYDGDGKRVKSTFNGTTTTYFVGNHYEVTGSTIIKYYYAGSQRIAMRTNGTLNYLLGDHLGSTSLITDSTGNKTNEQRYKAWGETRYVFGNEKTKYQYTGQYSYVSDFGLHFYNARWYDSSLGRFAQADTIIPDGVQGYDRYAYTNNNPIRYTDPSGHAPCWKERLDDGPQCFRDIDSPGGRRINNRSDLVWANVRWQDECMKGKHQCDEIAAGGEILGSVLFEPVDWANTVYDCINGDCSVLGFGFMVIPGLSGKIGNAADDAIQAFWRSEFAKYPNAPYAILGFSRDAYQEIARGLNGSFLWSNRYSEYIKKFGVDGFWQNINEPFVDKIITAGKDVFLATPLDEILASGKGLTFKEVTKLLKAGYSEKGSWLIAPP